MPEIDPEQAETVRYIYRAFLEGKAPSYIARDLTARGIPTPGGKTIWRANTIMSILTNEKYKGDALLQKTFCTDFLTKSYKVNEGEVPQYYVEHTVFKGFYKQLSSTAYLSNRVYDIMIKKSKCEV
jgi:hypothetical protein